MQLTQVKGMSTAYRTMSFLLLVSVTWLNVSLAATPILEKGVSMTLNASVSNPDYVAGLKLDNLVVLTDTNKNEYPVAYVNLPDSQESYLLRSGISMYELNLSTKMYLGGWDLKRTIDDSQAKIADLSRNNGRDQAGTEYDMQIGSENTQALGCLWDYPLRYGDVTGDGKTELVILPGRGEAYGGSNARLDFVLFSPQSHLVMFSARLVRESAGESLEKYDPDYKTRRPDWESLPQITGADGDSEDDAGMRYYAKLYFGDFDGNGKQDIIAWRKRYDSRTISDSVQGYKLTAQLLTHYEFVDGAYKAQTTDEATIKGWLAAKSLTWQKGYPSTSECASNAGKPIPETVDPLLNDPDVLQ